MIKAVYDWLISRKILVGLCLVLALGAGLRFYNLGGLSLWMDEAISVDFSSKSLSFILAHSWFDRTNPPLYWILLHWWIDFFGTSEAAVRSLSAVFGVLAVWVTYLVGKELFNPRAGLIAAFLSAISYFLIYYSQETRNYSLLLLFSLLSYLFFIRRLKSQRKIDYIAYFVFNLLLGYTHLYGLLIILSQVLYLGVFWKNFARARASLFYLWTADLLLFVPLGFLFFARTKNIVESGFWIARPDLTNIAGTLAGYAGTGRWLLPLVVVFGVFILAGIFVRQRAAQASGRGNLILKWLKALLVPETVLLILWLFVTLILPFIVSLITTPIYFTRYTIGATPALYILVARGIGLLNRRWLLGLSLVLIVVLSAPGLYSYFSSGVKEQWRETAAYVENRSSEGDIIIICSSYCQFPFNYYYRGSLTRYPLRSSITEPEKEQFLQQIPPDTRRVFLLLSHVSEKNWIRTHLESLHPVLAKQQFTGINVLLFDLQGVTKTQEGPE